MFNKVILMGRLTADPEFRQSQSGIPMCRFSIAVDRPFSSREGGEKKTDFFRVTTFRQQAEFVNRFFSKGRMAIIDGSVQNDDYTDQNGVKHYSCSVIAERVSFGETKSAAAANSGDFTANNARNVNNYQAQSANTQNPAASQNQMQAANDLVFGDLGDFEEILGDGNVPF